MILRGVSLISCPGTLASSLQAKEGEAASCPGSVSPQRLRGHLWAVPRPSCPMAGVKRTKPSGRQPPGSVIRPVDELASFPILLPLHLPRLQRRLSIPASSTHQQASHGFPFPRSSVSNSPFQFMCSCKTVSHCRVFSCCISSCLNLKLMLLTN